MKKVSIVGLGYVGSVLSLVCALAKNKKKLLYKVSGIDKKKELVKEFNSGSFPFKSNDKKIQTNFKINNWLNFKI